jgi:integrase
MEHENMLQRGGVWYVRARVRGKDTWRSTKQKDLRAAKRVGRGILTSLETSPSTSRPTVAQWWQTYSSIYLPRRAPNTRRIYAKMAEWFLLPRLGSLKLDEVPKSACVRMVNDLGRKYAPATVALAQSVGRALFQQAVEEGLLSVNPWKGIEKPQARVRERVLSPEEQEKLSAALGEEDRQWLLFMLGTGLRVGELAGMEQDGHYLTVVGKGSKPRRVPMLDRVPELLEGLPQRTPRQWQARLRAAAEAAGIPPVSPHTLRHTFATRYLQAGGDIYVLSKILGHSSVKITEQVYAHLAAEDLASRSKGIRLGLGVAESVAAGKILEFPREVAGAV